jgi:hypothetical protein
MKTTQVEYLLMLAEDVRDQGNEFIDEVQQRGQAQAKRILELAAMIERAREIIEREKIRFAHYMPIQHQHSHVASSQTPARVGVGQVKKVAE